MAGSEMVVLFGDELEEVSSARIGVKVASGVTASARDLAKMLLAVSVADLVATGAATVTEREVKRRFRTSTAVVVESRESGEGLVRAVSRVAAEPLPLDEIAGRLLGGRAAAPEMALIGLGYGLLEETGAVARRESLGGRLKGKLGLASVDIDSQRADALRPQWQELRGRWEAWRAAEDGLADRLVEGCRRALDQVRDTSD